MLSFILTMMVGCSTAENNKDTNLPHTQTTQEEEVFDYSSVDLGIQQSSDCSQIVESKVCDLILKDQNDEYFRLHDHYGKVIVLDLSAGWCGPCQRAAQTVQETQDFYDGYVVYVTILLEDDRANSPTLEFVQLWANTFEIETAPVLQGSRNLVDLTGETGYIVEGWPSFLIIDPELNIHSAVKGFSETTIHHQIQEALL